MVLGRPGALGTGRLTRGFALTTQTAPPSPAAFTSARLAAAPKHPPRGRALPRRGAPSSAHRGIGDSHQEPLEQRFGAPSPRPSSCWGWHRWGRGRCWAQAPNPHPRRLALPRAWLEPRHHPGHRHGTKNRAGIHWGAETQQHGRLQPPQGQIPSQHRDPSPSSPPRSSRAGVMLPGGCQAPKTNPVAKPLEEQRAGCLPLLPLQPGC